MSSPLPWVSVLIRPVLGTYPTLVLPKTPALSSVAREATSKMVPNVPAELTERLVRRRLLS